MCSLGKSLNIAHIGAYNVNHVTPDGHMLPISYRPYDYFLKLYVSIACGSIYRQNQCQSGCDVFCSNGFHYYFVFDKKNHGSIEDVCNEAFIRSEYSGSLENRYSNTPKALSTYGITILSQQAYDIFTKILRCKPTEVNFKNTT